MNKIYKLFKSIIKENLTQGFSTWMLLLTNIVVRMIKLIKKKVNFFLPLTPVSYVLNH